jgi:hypothetical protein
MRVTSGTEIGGIDVDDRQVRVGVARWSRVT